MMLQCVQRLPRVPLPGVQVRGHRPLAQARTGPGVGPAGGALFNANVPGHSAGMKEGLVNISRVVSEIKAAEL